MATVMGQARVISNFALTHYRAARQFSEKVRELEQENAGKEFGPFFSDISAYTASCIIVCAASLEALINEAFLTPGPLQASVPDFEKFFWGGREVRRKYWIVPKTVKVVGLERKSALKKYKVAANRLGVRPLSKSDSEFWNAELLFGFRNYLIHFKPLWDESRRHESLEDSLNGLFDLCPYVDAGSDFLSKKCMSFGCTEWAMKSVVEFVEYFLDRTDLFPKKLKAFRPIAQGAA